MDTGTRRNEHYHRLQKILEGLNAEREWLEKEVQETQDEQKKKELQQNIKQIENKLQHYRNTLEQHKKQLAAELTPNPRMCKSPLYYSDYIQVDKLLSAQLLESEKAGVPAHEEMLFIIVHQTYELWFKQILHELTAIINLMNRPYVPERDLSRVAKLAARIVEIMKLAVHQFDVLETMTPLDFMDFRDFLFPASGFQSWQFRLVENYLGLEPGRRATYERKSYHTKLAEEHQKLVQEAETKPNLFQVVEAWLARTPFLDMDEFKFLDAYKASVQKMFEEDRKMIIADTEEGSVDREKELGRLNQTEESFAALFNEELHNEQIAAGNRRLSYRATHAALLIWLYQEEPIFTIPYRLLTTLVDLDEQFAAWRHRHALMVYRMLGTKVGTGGSSGYWYLKSTIEKGRVFKDLGNLSSYILPRRDLPPLPKSFSKKINFNYSTEYEENLQPQ